MKRPPYGLSFPAMFQRSRDGDTTELEGILFLWAVREIDCWAKEKNRGSVEDRKLGREASEAAERFCRANSEHLSVWIPPPGEWVKYWRRMQLGEPPKKLNLFKLNTFDRVPGHVFLTDDCTLGEAMVKHGHATNEKMR